MSDNKVMSYYAYDYAGRLKQQVNLDNTATIVNYFAYQRDANGAPTWIRRAIHKQNLDS